MKFDPFTSEQRASMVALRRAWSDRKIVLIGASALACWLEMKWRRTNDLDLTVVADQAELADTLGDLGWTRDRHLEQRWTSPQEVIVDILPATAADMQRGKFTFAESGHVMNLIGFDLAFSESAKLELNDETSVDLATVPVIVLLKMAAWLDRPSMRDRDLEDLAHILNEYLDDADDRRWSDAVISAGVSHEDQSAFVLGDAIAKIAGDPHHRVLSSFLDAVSDEDAAPHAHFARYFRPGNSRAILASRIDAFRLGLRGARRINRESEGSEP